MYAIYGNIYHQYTPVMLAYIPYLDPMGTTKIVTISCDSSHWSIPRLISPKGYSSNRVFGSPCYSSGHPLSQLCRQYWRQGQMVPQIRSLKNQKKRSLYVHPCMFLLVVWTWLVYLWCFERWLHPPFKAMVPEAELWPWHRYGQSMPVDQGWSCHIMPNIIQLS